MKPQELFDALERGEKIEFRKWEDDEWIAWNGQSWHNLWKFRIVKPEPKLVPHWPAVFLGREGYWVSNLLYRSELEAPKDIGNFIKLATEYPPIMLEVKE